MRLARSVTGRSTIWPSTWAAPPSAPTTLSGPLDFRLRWQERCIHRSDLGRVDAQLPAEPEIAGEPGRSGNGVFVSDLSGGRIQRRRYACGPGGKDEPGAGVVKKAISAVRVDVEGEIDGAERQPGHAGYLSQAQDVHEPQRRFDERHEGEVLREICPQPGERSRPLSLGKHNAQQSVALPLCERQQRRDLGLVGGGVRRVHPHQRTNAPTGQRVHRRRQRHRLVRRGHRVLQVDDHDAGAWAGCLGKPLGAVAGNKQCGYGRGDDLRARHRIGQRSRRRGFRRRHWKSSVRGRLDSSGRADSTPGRWPCR